MTVVAPTPSDAPTAPAKGVRGPAKRVQRSGIAAHIFITVMAVIWVLPLLFTLYVSLRPESDTNAHGYFSIAHSLTFSNFSDAWTQGQLFHFFLNSVKITVPAVIITLFFASMVAFVVSRFNSTFNLIMLLLFTAGNLLPQQVLLAPLFKVFTNVLLPYSVASSGELYDSTVGIVAINVAFQTGFCVFVLSNFMRTLPFELSEAAMVDGASIWTQYWRITMPLCRPALAALATLLTTWIYNDFFWALTLMSTGSKRPVTSALLNLQGQFQTNQNLLSAAAFTIAIPTLAVYVALQKQFVAGLTLGSTKG